MADNSYKMELGIKLDTSDLQTQVNAAGDGIKPIEIKVDAETKELTNTIKEALKSLSSGTKNALTLDTTKLESSLNDVTSTIREIKTAIGTLDNGSNMKSLVSSINSISTALDRASDKFDGLLTDLKSLSGKDFNLNFGITMGGSNPIGRNAAYGSKVRNETLPQLKQQMSELVKYYNSTYKSSLSEFEVLQRMVSGTKLGTGDFFENFLFGKDSVASRMNGGSLASQMQAHKEYIDMFKQAASLRGLDLTPVTSNFSKTADDLITDAQNIQTGANEMQDGFEKLKQVFGGNSTNVEGISTQLDSIVVDLGEIKTTIQGLSSGVSLDGLAQSFDKLSNSIELLVKNCGNMKTVINDSVGGLGGSVGKSGSGLKNIENDLKQVTVTADNTSDAIQSMRNAMSSMKFNTSSIDAATKDLEEMNIVIKEVVAKQGNNFDITVKGINDVGEAVDIIKRFNAETGNFEVISTKISKPFNDGAEAAKRFKKEAETVKNIKLDIEVGTYDNQISQMDDRFNRLSNASKELRESVEQVHKAYERMELAIQGTGDEVADRERLIQAEKELARALEKTNNLSRIQARIDKDDNDRLKLVDDRQIFQSKIDAWLTKNSAATKKFGAAMLDLKSKAENCDRVNLNHLEKEFKQLDYAADKAGLKIQSTLDRVKSKFKEYMAYFSVAEVFMWVEQGLREMFNTVKEIDTAMTGLYRVTDLTASQYDTLFNNMISSAKEYGATLNDIINATTDWVRAGFDADTALGMAEVTTMYQHISDLDYDTASENLITAYNGFKNELLGLYDGDEVAAVNYIADVFNELDNNFAVTSAGLGEAMKRSASALDLAGNTIQETAGMITGMSEVTQDPEKAGNALKVLSLRLRGMKGALEELGEETDENVENISKMQGQILNMTKGKVNIFDSTGNFKSTYEIMQGIAQVWDDLSSIDQADLLETIAGKHRANDVAALLSNWENVEAAVKSASEAEGSAAKENAKYIDSIQGRLDKLTTVWQSFANTFMSSDLLKGAISGLTKFVEILESLIDNFGLLGTAGLGTLGTGIFKYFTKFKDNFKDVADVVDIVDDAVETIDNVGDVVENVAEVASNATGAMVNLGGATGKTTGAFKAFMKTPMGIASAIGVAVAAISLLYNWYKKTKEEASKLRQEAIEASDEFLDSALSFEKAYIKYSGKTNLTVEEEEELESAIKGTVDALGDKSSALQSAVNSSNDYVASLEAIKNAELEAAKNAAEEKRDKAAEELREAAIGWESWDGSEVNIEVTGEAEGKAKEIAKTMGSEFVKSQHVSVARSPQAIESVTLRLSGEASTEDIVKYYNFLKDYQKELEVAGLENTKIYQKVESAIGDMSEAISVYTDGVYEAVKANYQLDNGIPKTTEDYLEMREAVLRDEKLRDFSIDKKMAIINALDSEYKQIFDLSSAEVQARKFIGIINGYGDGTKDGTDEIGTVESFINMRTAVNNNECSVGEYLSQFDKINEMTENWSDEEKELLNSSFGFDTDTIKHQYNEMSDYLLRLFKPRKMGKGDTLYSYASEVTADKERAQLNIEEFLKGLTADELAAVISIRTEIDWENSSTEDIRKQIQDQAAFIRAMDFSIAIDIEAEGIESLNTAMAESVSGAGLSSESIKALKSRYSELASEGYDLSSMFEETSNGIHLNREAVNELEKTLASKKLSETDSNLKVLKGRYDDLTKEIKNCTDAGERANLYNEQQEVARKINDLATLASQYEGLTSVYQEWQNVESSGSERDMYEQVIEGFENIGDEISRGWYDDGTIKFLELMTGKTDLAGKSASELKKIWKGLDKNIKNTSYSVKDFFTTDDDGNSTSTGVYNFLRALQELESSDTVSSVLGKQFKDIENIKDLVTVKDGKITTFNFDVVGGDEAIAEALGISEELVQIMLRAADDAGFVVTLDGNYTQLADLKTSAEEANNTLKKLKSEGLDNLKDTDLSFDFSANNLQDLNAQLEKATSVLDKFRNKDGTINMKAEGAEEALEIASYFTATLDKLTEPVYMQIETNEVEKDLQKPLEKMQEFERLTKEKHQLALTGDTKGLKEVEKEMDGIAKELDGLDKETKIKLGIEGLTTEEIKSKLEKGEIEIPATVDIQLEISDDIKDMRLMMMNQLGLISDEQLKLELQYDVDYSAVEDYTPEQQKAVVEFFAEHSEVDKYSPEDKEALVKLIAKKENPDDWKIEDVDAVVKYYADDEQIKDWSPEEKKAYAKYLVDGGQVDDWSPEAKDAFVKYLVDGGDPDKFDPADKESWVVYKKDSTIPDGYKPNDPHSTVVYAINTDQIDGYNPPNYDRYVTYYVRKAFTNGANAGKKVLEDRFGFVNGTANSDGSAFVGGTFGKAYKQGDWGVKKTTNALTGELGQELVVYGNRYWTVGDNGAEFATIPKGAIVFNHKQTKELFANGKVTSNGGRGVVFANGTAFAQGTAFGSGSGGGEESEVESYKAGSSSESKFEDTIDWIETILDRAERAIDKYEKQANNQYKTWSKRNKVLENEIAEVNSTISLYKQAKNQYWSELSSVGLDEVYATRVREGLATGKDAIENFEGESDEKLVEKIKNYQDLYNKYLDCIDKIDELREQEASLYSERFDNVQSEYDNLLQGFDHTESMLNEYISQAEAKGQIVSKNYYAALIDNEEDRINTLKQEQTALIKARDEAVANNEFDKYSEDWYRMCAEIDGVTQEIEAANTATIEWANNIRDIDWEIFDLIQQRITDITDEADFLIELMSNKDLFDDNGKFTKQGTATVGLHAQNYNTYMYQADLAGEEAAKLKQQLAANPDDTTNLEEQYRQRIAEQREYILAAEDAKNAIIDLVEEGINLEIEALDEKIQKYQDALDAQKDLYDYQKRVEEQTKEISSLQKQISAYEGDNSEETKAKIQELKVSLEEAEADLEETEYDKYITDQQKLLDSLYTEYESMLNERLDRSDDLVRQVIESINATTGENGYVTSALGADGAIATALGGNAATIKETLEKEATNVGAKLSDAMNNIWNLGEQPVLTMYGEGFQNKQTTTNSVLSGIKISVDSMVASLNKEAAKKTTANKTSTSAQKNPTTTTNKNNSNTANNTSSNSNKITEDTLKSIAAAIWVHGSKAGWEDDPTRKNKLSAKLGAANAKKVQEYINKYGANGELYRYWYSNNKSLDKYKYSAFKFGAKKIDESQLAWTQEAGQEYIVRPSDGAILTPVAKGDSVLTAQASNNIWQMANSPAEFIKDNLNLGSASVPNNSTVQNSYTQHLDKVVFSFPNVKNYDEMLSAMQKDPNFERLVESMSIGKLAGKSSLAKGKAIR